MSDWREVALGDLVIQESNGFATGPFGSAVSAKSFALTGTPMIRGSNLSLNIGVRLSDDEVVFIGDEIVERYSRSIAVLGDLIFTCWGTVGQVGLIDSRARYEKYLVSNKQMKMTPDRSRVCSEFLYYALARPETVQRIQGSAIGSSVPGFNLGQLKTLSVRIPDLVTQRAIAEVLGALDDKIVANRHLADCICDLQTELWRAAAVRVPEVPLTSVAEPHLGGTPPRGDASAWGGSVGWASVRDVTSAECGVIFETAETIDEEMARSVRRLNPLPKGSVVLTARGTVGSVAVLGVACAINQSAYAFVPGAGESTVLRCAVEAAVGELRSKAHGSVFSTITMQTLNEIRVPDLFGGSAPRLAARLETLEERRHTALIENGVLVRARDELLPLLMDGRLTVKDAEKRVEEVVWRSPTTATTGPTS